MVRVPTAVAPESFGASVPAFVDAGDGFTMVVTADGALYACGMNAWCQLGLGDHACPPFLKHVGDTGKFKGQLARSMRCGSVHSIILTEDNTLWSCGLATEPLCGTQDRVAGYVKIPARVRHARFHGNDVIVFAAGVSHSAATTSTGDLYTWGPGVNYSRIDSFKYSALGHNNSHIQWLPRKVPPVALGGARIGRWHDLRQDFVLAFVMATHKRLGQHCVFHALLCEIIIIIFSPVYTPKTLDGFECPLRRLS